MTTTMNVKDEDIIANKVVSKRELKEYHDLIIPYAGAFDKWLILHNVQNKIQSAINSGTVEVIEQEVVEKSHAPGIKIQYSPGELMKTRIR